MKAIFAVPMANSNAVLPPMSGDGVQLHYTVDGVLRGGYSLIGQVPIAGIPGCLVLIDSSPETIQAMHDDAAYLWIEDVVEVNDGEGI